MFAEPLTSVAHRLVEHCRNDTTELCLQELYAPDAVSVEAVATPGGSRETAGVAAIRQKHDWWYSTFEVHESLVDGPYLHGDDRFAVIFEVDTTNRETGERGRMREIGVYTVLDGKIVREEFLYAA